MSMLATFAKVASVIGGPIIDTINRLLPGGVQHSASNDSELSQSMRNMVNGVTQMVGKALRSGTKAAADSAKAELSSLSRSMGLTNQAQDDKIASLREQLETLTAHVMGALNDLQRASVSSEVTLTNDALLRIRNVVQYTYSDAAFAQTWRAGSIVRSHIGGMGPIALARRARSIANLRNAMKALFAARQTKGRSSHFPMTIGSAASPDYGINFRDNLSDYIQAVDGKALRSDVGAEVNDSGLYASDSQVTSLEGRLRQMINSSDPTDSSFQFVWDRKSWDSMAGVLFDQQGQMGYNRTAIGTGLSGYTLVAGSEQVAQPFFQHSFGVAIPYLPPSGQDDLHFCQLSRPASLRRSSMYRHSMQIRGSIVAPVVGAVYHVGNPVTISQVNSQDVFAAWESILVMAARVIGGSDSGGRLETFRLEPIATKLIRTDSNTFNHSGLTFSMNIDLVAGDTSGLMFFVVPGAGAINDYMLGTPRLSVESTLFATRFGPGGMPSFYDWGRGKYVSVGPKESMSDYMGRLRTSIPPDWDRSNNVRGYVEYLDTTTEGSLMAALLLANGENDTRLLADVQSLVVDLYSDDIAAGMSVEDAANSFSSVRNWFYDERYRGRSEEVLSLLDVLSDYAVQRSDALSMVVPSMSSE